MIKREGKELKFSLTYIIHINHIYSSPDSYRVHWFMVLICRCTSIQSSCWSYKAKFKEYSRSN